jgi:hypothetical protein
VQSGWTIPQCILNSKIGRLKNKIPHSNENGGILFVGEIADMFAFKM